MTDRKSDQPPEGFTRNDDGILTQKSVRGFGERNYQTPNEAVMTWYSGKLRFGCNERVFSNYNSHACGKAAKYDPDHRGNPTKCGHHSAARVAAKKEKEERERKERIAAANLRNARYSHRLELEGIVRKIADGHNDPRGLCSDWLERKARLGEGIMADD